MDESQAIRAFGALSQETRLGILSIWGQTGPEGRAAGEIADLADVSPSNVSFHLKELERGGLVPNGARRARSSIAAADPAIAD